MRNVFVLSGGGSRGAAQIGMLRGLLGAGIVPDAIVGASVGALNGCCVAASPTLDRVEELADAWMQMSEKSLIGSRRSAALNVVRRRPYLFGSARLRDLIAAWVPAERLEDLEVPVRVATTDLGTGRSVHHDSGPVLDLLAASTALPALLPPVTLDGRVHVDAGVSENLPVSATADMVRRGDRVWLLDVTKHNTSRGLHSPLHVLVAALAGSITNRPTAAFAPDTQVVQCKLDESFDCGPVFDFRHTGTLFRLGEQTALSALDAAGTQRARK